MFYLLSYLTCSLMFLSNSYKHFPVVFHFHIKFAALHSYSGVMNLIPQKLHEANLDIGPVHNRKVNQDSCHLLLSN